MSWGSQDVALGPTILQGLQEEGLEFNSCPGQGSLSPLGVQPRALLQARSLPKPHTPTPHPVLSNLIIQACLRSFRILLLILA